MRLGKYQLSARIASTGLSQVWRARDSIEGREVALKIPTPCARGSEEEELLVAEIRLAARLIHPNILRIRNADKVGNLYIIATDLATESLEDRIRRRMATGRALSYARQMLLGLAHAHQNRVIHRDMKPSNVMLFAGDRVRISDFGLARVVKTSMISATGSGTLLYFPPEQAHGYPCFASDVFSLGLIWYEMLSGKLPRWPFEWPYEGLETLESRVPVELCRIIRKATQLDHRLRYHDAPEMLRAFERIEPAIRRFLSPPAKRRRRQPRLGAWRDVRFREFSRAFGRKLFLRFECPDCHGPISEHMSSCPWCGTEGLHFAEESDFPSYCSRCKRGLRNEWRYCPWCWGPGFPEADGTVRPDPRYRGKCQRCHDPLFEGMKYCPWCHGKIVAPVTIPGLADRCRECRGRVSAAFWDYCPWCANRLVARRRHS